MTSLKDIETEVGTAMKAGNKMRVNTLRMLVNTVKLIAKNDGNREPTDDDVLMAGNRMVKQTRETLSFLREGNEKDMEARANLEAEIAVVEEFLPKKMSRDELTALINGLIAESPAQGKAAKGYVMKALNQNHKGLFDAATANEIVTEKVGA